MLGEIDTQLSNDDYGTNDARADELGRLHYLKDMLEELRDMASFTGNLTLLMLLQASAWEAFSELRRRTSDGGSHGVGTVQ